jgi:chromosomal replication initiation ATPase DnaA
MPRVLVRDCVIAAAEVWGVTPAQIAGRRRWRPVAEARQAAAWLAAALTGQSETEIGRRLDRDRTTISHAIGRTARRRVEDAALREALERAERLALALAAARGAAWERAA